MEHALYQTSDVLAAVDRAMQREARRVRYQFQNGLTSVATITSLATLVGLCGTVRELYNSFRAESLFGTYATLSDALYPTLAGLFISISAYLIYQHLSASINAMTAEMSNMSVELRQYLASYRVKVHRDK